MFYFSFHITDYRAATAHLSNEEDLAYRRLLEMYYDTEMPIPLETQWVAKRLRLGSEVIDTVLRDMFVHTEEGWRHTRCDKEIAHYHQLTERNRNNGKLGGRPSGKAKNPAVTQNNPDGSQWQPTGKATNNHKPITNNQEPLREKRATRLPNDFELPAEWIEWTQANQPHVDARATFDTFKDYWIAKSGANATKLDWFSTWRNWVRRETDKKPTAKQESFYEREQAAKRKKWEEMTGRAWPSDQTNQTVIDVTPKTLEIAHEPAHQSDRPFI
jgi:uncharacterized protein YdaU (DUF1376 family)